MNKLKKLKELTKDLTVLYVEDEIEIQQTMHRYLKKFFAHVSCANNGLEGLKEYQKNSYNLVITDLSMPRMDGLDMIVQMKELNEEQAILITTAHTETKYMVGAIKSHIDGYIIKPFDYEQLNTELFKISEKLKKFRENEEYKLHLIDMVNTQTSQLQENYDTTLFSMIEMIEKRDTYTAGHSRRVAEYSQKIAKEMGYSREDQTMIYQAGMLHDVGKIATPDTVLLNPKELNEIEYKLIQEHVTVSYQIISNIPMFKPLAEIVYSHHERNDGKGYPRGLKDEEITHLARIMIVADAFDAMTTNRIYKGRKSVQEAIAELLELSGKQFHPEVAQKAAIALKDVIIDDKISQLPQTQLEEERFAYFYKDTLSEVYNQNYLDVILRKNSYTKEFRSLEIFLINNFSIYNKKNGWDNGDKFLASFASVLRTHFKDSLVFRVFGDDFVVVSEKIVYMEEVVTILDEMTKNEGISYQVKSIDPVEHKISEIAQIENI